MGTLPLRIEDPSQAETVLRTELAQAAPLVIVGGGDGTLSHAAGLLARTETALATPSRAAWVFRWTWQALFG